MTWSFISMVMKLMIFAERRGKRPGDENLEEKIQTPYSTKFCKIFA
jgi:hypothetical protein